MNSEQFAFWLQGFFELTDSNNLTASQVKMIKEHLGLVFSKVTPPLQKSELPPPLPKVDKSQYTPSPATEELFGAKDFKEIFDEANKFFKDVKKWKKPWDGKTYC